MKILHCIHSINSAGGGPVEFIRQLATIRHEFGVEMAVACLDDRNTASSTDFPCPVNALGPGSPGYGYSKEFVPWLEKTRSDFDLVWVHGIWQYSSFGTWLALHQTDSPYVVLPQGMLDPWFNRKYPLKHLKKRLYWPVAEYKVLRDARAVLFTCEEERLLARQSFSPYRCREVITSLGTIGPTGNRQSQIAAFQAKFPELNNKRLLLFLGRIHEKKGADILLSAFAKIGPVCPELQLVMAGPSANNYAAQLKVSFENQYPALAQRVTWTGMLSGDLRWGAFYSAEAFILPSHQENFGLAVAEALACSLPVLISNRVNIWREIQAYGGGLVESDCLAGVESLLQRWLQLSDQQRDEFKENARKCFENVFEIRQVFRKLLPDLEHCINSIQP